MGGCCSSCCADGNAVDAATSRQHRKRRDNSARRASRSGSHRGSAGSKASARPQGQATLRTQDDDAHSLTASLYSADMDDFHSCQEAFSHAGSPLSSPRRMSLDTNAQQLHQHPPAHRQPRRASVDATLLPRPPTQLSSVNTTAAAVRLSADSSCSPQSPLGCRPLSQHHPQHPGVAGSSEASDPHPQPGCLPDLLGNTLEALASNLTAPGSPARRLGAPSQQDGGASAGRRRSMGQCSDPTAASLSAAAASAAHSGRKCDAGCSLALRDASIPEPTARLCYENADATHFKVRGVDYATTRLKIHSEQALYELVAADTFACDTKQDHIARCINLPSTAGPVRHTPSGTPIPQLLIVNIQIPTYAPALWGGKSDGPGCSIVFYFRLRPEFDPATFTNQKALQLFERFIIDGKEADGAPTRDRFKLIGRVVNVDEWAREGPLSSAESRLLTAYNEKPLLTRPQQRFYSGEGYLEVDVDIHAYTYIARAAFQAYVARLGPVVWENAFVIQGNTADELPEQVLGAARVHRTDLTELKPLSSYMA